jgi:hypothetical protein
MIYNNCYINAYLMKIKYYKFYLNNVKIKNSF